MKPNRKVRRSISRLKTHQTAISRAAPLPASMDEMEQVTPNLNGLNNQTSPQHLETGGLDPYERDPNSKTAPYGRDPLTGKPNAPYGLRKDGLPKTRPSGGTAQRKADRPPADHVELPQIGISKPGDKQLVAALAQYYGMLGMIVFPVNQYDGTVIMQSAASCAESLVAVGNKYPDVKKVLVGLTAHSEVTTAVITHVTLLIAIGANHRIVPPGFARIFGIQVPETPQPQAQPPSPQPHTQGLAPLTPEQEAYQQQWQQEQAAKASMEQQAALEQMIMQAAAEAMAQQMRAPGYNPQDTAPRPEQNPAYLQGLIGRQ